VQSVHITTKVVSGQVYLIQLYVIKFASDTIDRWFSPGPRVSSTNKTDLHDITEILLKVALNTITLTPNANTNRDGQISPMHRELYVLYIIITLLNGNNDVIIKTYQ